MPPVAEQERTSAPPYGGPWFDSPFLPRLLAESNLTDDEREQVERYARDGYLVLEPEELGIADLDSHLDRVIAEAEPLYRGAPRVQDGWSKSGAIEELALAQGVTALLERLYRREIVPFQTLNFEHGTEQDTHSDSFHFHCLPKFFMCGVWVALEDIDADNGPLHVYPGSHRLPDYDVLDLAVPPAGNKDTSEVKAAYERFVAEMLATSGIEKKCLEVRRGQAVLWAANLYHGGEPIRDPARTRQSQVSHYYFADCLYYSPMRSDPAHGQLAIQRPRNIRTGSPVPLRAGGKRIPVSVSDRMRWYAPAIMQRLRVWKQDSRRF